MAAKNKRANLLIEIGTEELPAEGLEKLAETFARNFVSALVESEVCNDAKDFDFFATPRRLAVCVKNVQGKAPTRKVERRGPSTKVAFDANGKPGAAALGFAKSCGVDFAMLDTLKTDHGEWLVHQQKIGGKKLNEIVTEGLHQVMRALPIAKRMRWGEQTVEFVRPVHWLLALHGTDLVKTVVFGLKAERFTRGHRFHAKGKLRIPGADDYAALLESEGRVIADFDQRRRVIKKQLAQLADKAGAQVVADAGLLDRVTGLVEWPQALKGDFDRRYLKLPGEVLVSCMSAHQKYFHLTDDKGKLLPGFIAVSNIKSTSPTRVRQGNERVLRARLADAEFFWNSDLKIPLAARVEQLDRVLFHNRLGSLGDKTARVVQLARRIAAQLGADAEQAARAALLCKADLVTDMVGEFPELQGTMGRYYAQKSAEEKSVADAIEQHYWPRHAGGKLPRNPIAQSVAVADRIDSLIGIFASGEAPTGDKDPFALRRAALGVLRILIEKQLDLDLRKLLQEACDSYEKHTGAKAVPNSKTIEQVFAFMLARLKAYYQPMGYTGAELDAVMACKPSKPLDFDRRLKALSRFFKEQPEAADSLAAANKRITGILGKSNLSETAAPRYDASLSREKAEVELARRLDDLGARANKNFSAARYDAGFVELSKLKQPIDSFFDQVMVMDEDAKVRKNRLVLLLHIRQLFLGAADISLMRVK